MFKYYRTKEGLVRRIYNHQKESSKRREHKLPSYSVRDLEKFALANESFHNLYERWVESGYEKSLTPSFDRLDDNKPYSFDNFNDWMTWDENNKKASLTMRNGKTKNGGKKRVPVIRIHPETKETVVYISIHEAKRQNNFSSPSSISDVISGRKDKAGGYYWKRAV